MAKVIRQVNVGSTDTLIVASRANEIINSLNGLLNMQIKPEGAGTLEVGDDGGSILTINVQSGGQAVDTGYPFKLEKTQFGTIRVYYGMINYLIPSGMVIGDSPPFTLLNQGSAYVYLEFNYNDNTGVLSNAEVKQGSSVPASTATVLYKHIGSYSANGDNITNVVRTSLWFGRCGTYDLFGSA